MFIDKEIIELSLYEKLLSDIIDEIEFEIAEYKTKPDVTYNEAEKFISRINGMRDVVDIIMKKNKYLVDKLGKDKDETVRKIH